MSDHVQFLRWVSSAPLEEVRQALDMAERRYLDRSLPGWPEGDGELVAATTFGKAYHLTRPRPHTQGQRYLGCQGRTPAHLLMTQESARNIGLNPCRVCRKHRLELLR